MNARPPGGYAELSHTARFGRKESVSSDGGIVVTSHPIATQVAADVLRDGGNACDAALAAAVTQTVVEPHMTTITGMLSLLHRDATTGATVAMNASVNAPMAPMDGFSAADAVSGRGVAVPGFWAGVAAASERLGRLPLRRLVEPAIGLARDGFPVHPFLWGYAFTQCALIGRSDTGRAMFFPDGSFLEPWATLRQADAADTLERLVDEGADTFYGGTLGTSFCDALRAAGGEMTVDDLAAYDVRWDAPATGTYRGYDIVTMPPPDCGSNLVEVLNMVELLDLERLGPPATSAETMHRLLRITEEVKDANASSKDPRSHAVPVDVLLSKEYAAQRLALLDMADVTDTAAARPPGIYPGTCHVTVVDGAGDIATVKHSCLCLPWSNGLFWGGVTVAASGWFAPPRTPAPGHRTVLYGAANIVLRDGTPVMASGSPGVGLLACVTQCTVDVLDFGMGVEEAVHLPRYGSRYLGGVQVEADVPDATFQRLRAAEIPLEVVEPWCAHLGTFEGVVFDDAGRVTACGDPRRNSTVEAVP